jgi:hypothetical protein
VAIITFHDDLSLSGYGITLKSAGLLQLSGTWRPGAAGGLVGTYIQESGQGSAAGFFTATVAGGNKLRARLTASNGRLVMAGEPLGEPQDHAGSWMAQIVRPGEVSLGTVNLSPRESLPAVFDLSGEGYTPGGRIQITGLMLITSAGAVGLYLESEPTGEPAGPSSLIGNVSANRRIAKLKGGSSGGRIRILAIKQAM